MGWTSSEDEVITRQHVVQDRLELYDELLTISYYCWQREFKLTYKIS